MTALLLAAVLSLDPFIGAWTVRVFGLPGSYHQERAYRIELARPVAGAGLFGWTRDDVLASFGLIRTWRKGREWPLALLTQSDRMGFCHRFVGRPTRAGMKGWVALYDSTCEQRRFARYFRWQARRDE